MPRSLWTCPRCGRRFANARQWHSCQVRPLAAHFKGKDPAVRRLYDRLLRMARAHGAVKVIPQKTRIAFYGRVGFAAVQAQKSGLRVGLHLPGRHRHHCLQKVEQFTATFLSHTFRIDDPADLDAEFDRLLSLAHEVGRGEHIGAPPPPRRRRG